MNYGGGVPVRQPLPDVPQSELSIAPTSPESHNTDENFVAHLRLLWNNRNFVLQTGIFALVASTLIAALIPASYESTTRLMPPDSPSAAAGLATAVAGLTGSAALGGLAGPGGIAGDILGIKSNSEVFVGILSSRTVQDKLIQQFDLKKLYGVRRMEDARKQLAKHTDITIDRKSQIIKFVVTDHDPKRAAAMGQAYVEELNRLVAELSTSSARRERIFLEERLQSVSKDLESAEKEFSQFASKNTAIDIKEQGKAMVEAAAVLQGQLIAAESQLEGLREIYSDNNVRVRAVRARIDELKNQLEKMAGKGEQLSAPTGRQADPMYPSIRTLPLLGVTYADLYRRTRVQEAVFETLTKEYELAKVQEVKEIPVVKVLDSPNVPDKKSFPPYLLMTSLGMILGLCAASAWVLGRTSWEQTDSTEPSKVFAQEVLTTLRASLPKFARNGSGSQTLEGTAPTEIPLRPDENEERK